MKIGAKTDYSTLFSSLNNSTSNNALTDLSWLSDYSSIKSGSYGKLMKAYYASDSSKAEDTKAAFNSTETATAESKAYTKVSTNADSIQNSIKNIEKLDENADSDKVYSAVKSYVDDYNNLLESTGKVSDTSIDGRITSIKGYTADNSDKLAKIGITVGTDGKLTLDKDKLQKADKNQVNELFANKGSYGYSVSVSAAMVQSTANYDAAKLSTYTSSGSYSANVGSLWDSIT